MQLSYAWLSDFVELPAGESAVADLARKLVQCGIEVEAIADPAKNATGVVVGLVEKCDKHPEADKLHVCTVFDGQQRYTVVCGAPNVAAGQRVAFARVGAILPGLTITPRTLRGVASAGMLCGRDELGLPGDSVGIWVLPADAELGANVFAAAGLAPVLTLSIAANRGDLLSHHGVAREVGAQIGKRPRPVGQRAIEKGPDVSTLARVLVDDPSGCKKYAARVIRNVNIGPSPAWLQERLLQLGQRPINNVVDVTNYVMLELGQPLHAFDLSKIAIDAGVPTVRVRKAKPNERVTLLDASERELAEDDIVIADSQGAIALAGVMGGQNSEVRAETTQILLESAYFDAGRVRKTARRLGLRSEASLRFERGVDLAMVQKALDRAAHLLSEVAGGEVAKGSLDVSQKPEPAREIVLRVAAVERHLGVGFTAEQLVQMLEPLEIRCVSRNEGSLRFAVPTFRSDLSREIDLVEDVARRFGYDNIPETLPGGHSAYVEPYMRELPESRVRTALLACGVSESVSYGFGSPERFREFLPKGASLVLLQNPQGQEFSAMRTSLLPGLLTALAHNQRHGQKNVRLFEIGTVMSITEQSKPDADVRDRNLPTETRKVAWVMAGGRFGGRWHERGETVDFLDAAGAVESLLEAVGIAGQVHREAMAADSVPPFLNPWATADLKLAGASVGFVGQLHPKLLDVYKAVGPVFAAELDLSVVPDRAARAESKSLPKFPGTQRDIAVIAPKTLAAEEVRAFLAEHAGGAAGRGIVEGVSLFDVYVGTPIPKTHVSLAFAIRYRHHDRTLTDEEVGEAFAQVQAELCRAFPVEVRGST